MELFTSRRMADDMAFQWIFIESLITGIRAGNSNVYMYIYVYVYNIYITIEKKLLVCICLRQQINSDYIHFYQFSKFQFYSRLIINILINNN